MPVCTKCKKHSNCLTTDFCDHCGAKDWDETTVLTFSGKPRGKSTPGRYAQAPQASRSSETSEGLGCLLGLAVVAGIAYGAYYFFFVPDNEQLANKYNVPVQRVSAPPMPHGCAYNDAPLGNKHCHYDKHVYVYDRNGQVIEIDGKQQACPAVCGAASNVEQVFVKVED